MDFKTFEKLIKLLQDSEDENLLSDITYKYGIDCGFNPCTK